jgi:endonuclease V-like protein UPF0215 family
MTVQGIREVKKQIRILSLAAKSIGKGGHYFLVGVVYRGRLCLDGIMSALVDGGDLTSEIVRMVTASRHHPQIRVIVYYYDSLNGATIDPESLVKGVSRPVIVLGFDGVNLIEGVPLPRLDFKQGESSIPAFSVCLSRETALRVLSTSSVTNAIPEAVRVAELVVSAVVN